MYSRIQCSSLYSIGGSRLSTHSQHHMWWKCAAAPGHVRRYHDTSNVSVCSSDEQQEAVLENQNNQNSSDNNVQIDKEVTKFARSAATTFAPRASGATNNPAYKGSLLYTIFDVQAWLSLGIGALLSFNVLFPSDQPDIARLLGMWSIWMFTVPSLRARECDAAEKDALNLLFLAIPLVNVLLPFVWKNFGFIFAADCVLLAGVFAWKGVAPFDFMKKENEE